MNNTKTEALLLMNNGVQFEKVMMVGGTILVIFVLGYKVLKKMVRTLIGKVEQGIDYLNRDEIEMEKARTAELLQKYEMETNNKEDQEKVYTRII